MANLNDIPYAVIAVQRPSTEVPPFENPLIQVIKNTNGDMAPFSSTLVRDLWCEGKPIEQLTSKEIQQYMEEHELVKSSFF